LSCGPLLRNLDQELAGPAKNWLNHRVGNSSLLDSSSQPIDGWRLFESRRHDRTAFEIDAEIESVSAVWMKFMAIQSRAHSQQHEQNRKAKEEPALAEPINVYLVKYS
jgi:hypothetical protein